MEFIKFVMKGVLELYKNWAFEIQQFESIENVVKHKGFHGHMEKLF